MADPEALCLKKWSTGVMHLETQYSNTHHSNIPVTFVGPMT
jgi:hypothetical protein